MTQRIDPEALKASAEHLEWVLQQYPDEPSVAGLLVSLQPLIDAAKSGSVKEPVDQQKIPSGYGIVNGDYRPYKNPDVEDAYVDFTVQMKGGYTQSELEIIARLDERRRARAKEASDD